MFCKSSRGCVPTGVWVRYQTSTSFVLWSHVWVKKASELCVCWIFPSTFSMPRMPVWKANLFHFLQFKWNYQTEMPYLLVQGLKSSSKYFSPWFWFVKTKQFSSTNLVFIDIISNISVFKWLKHCLTSDLIPCVRDWEDVSEWELQLDLFQIFSRNESFNDNNSKQQASGLSTLRNDKD